MDAPSEDPVKAFYDELADDYHLIYEDWWRSVERQGKVLADLIASRVGPGSRRILDCTCGIGTQSLGLSMHGHTVLGTDSSDAAVARAQREATQRGLPAKFRAWDVRDLARLPGGPFDVVLSGDNSLPHLTTDEDLARAVREMWCQTAPGGAVVVTTRDYDELVRERPRWEGPRVIGPRGQRRVVLQLWDWSEDGSRYRMDHMILREGAEGWTTSVRTCEYRALQRAELERCFSGLGAKELQWLDPSESGFFQRMLWVSRADRRRPGA